jgi:hypothetical protein
VNNLFGSWTRSRMADEECPEEEMKGGDCERDISWGRGSTVQAASGRSVWLGTAPAVPLGDWLIPTRLIVTHFSACILDLGGQSQPFQSRYSQCA